MVSEIQGQGLGFGQAQMCGRIKSFNGITILLLLILVC